MAVPEQTVRALQEAFFLFDFDKDGRIAASELGVVMRSVGLNPTEGQLKEMTNEVKNKGGSVDMNSLVQLIGSRHNTMTTTANELTDSFQVFDKQGNGMLSTADIKHGLSSLGERLTDEEIDGLFREADPNGEGQCNINDLVKLLMK